MLQKAREIFTLTGREGYQYEPLPRERCIRLLHIEPDEPSATICCSLRIVDLDENPSFTALSYSWKKDIKFKAILAQFDRATRYWMLYYLYKWRATSLFKDQVHLQDVINEKRLASKISRAWKSIKTMEDESDSKKVAIICNGKVMRVHPNLFDALIRLRSSRPGYYWIDALCINQKDADERSAQVQIMGSIYSAAALVVIWLGVLPASTHPGITRLIGLAEPNVDGATLVDPTSLEAISRVLNEPKRTELILSLGYLLTRRWFRRLWIIQECCLAREHVFMLGDHEFGASTLITIISCMTQFANGPLKPIFRALNQLVPHWENLIQSIPVMLRSSEDFRRGERWPLSTWILMVKGRKAKDLRDAIFAGLALVPPEDFKISQQLQLRSTETDSSTSSMPSSELWDSLHADYNAEISCVLLNLAACILTKYNWKSLFITTLWWRGPPDLSKAAGLPLYEYPSWIPDPSAWTSNGLQPFFAVKNADSPLPKTSCTIEDQPRISSDGTTLFLMGAQLDKVGQWSPLQGLKTKSYEGLFRLIQWIAYAVPQFYQPGGCSGMEALTRVLMSGHQATRQQPNPIEYESLLAGLCRLIHLSVHDMIIKANEGQPTNPMEPKEVCLTDQQKSQIIEAFETAKEQHAYAPWPTEHVSEDFVKGPRSEQLEGSTLNTESQNLAQENLSSRTQTATTDRIDAFIIWLLVSAIPGINSMSIFMTEKGYMGLGTMWLQEGDHIFLIRGGMSPYIFAHMDDVLRRTASEIRNQIDLKTSRSWHKRAKALQTDLEAVESRIGRKDGWQLVGEAYVEGVMKGEVAEDLQELVERISIV